MIEKYLKTLLVTSKRVIIPDFGGFVVKRTASGDAVSFNSFLKFNDDLLLKALMQGEDLEKSEALKRIKADVEEINEILNKDGYCQLQGVGYLVKDKKNNVRYMDHLDDTVVKKSTGEKPDEKESENNEIDDRMEKEPIPVPKDMQESDRPGWLLPAIIAAIIAVLVAAWFLFLKPENSDDKTLIEKVKDKRTELVEEKADEVIVSKEEEKEEPIVEEEENVVEDATQEEEIVERSDDVLVAPEKEKVSIWKRIAAIFSRKNKSSKADTNDQVKAPSGDYVMEPLQVKTESGIKVVADKKISSKGGERYNVIIGSFSDKNNAKSFQQRMVDDGYGSELFDRYNGFVAVSIGGYPSLDIALRVCGESLEQYPDLWILVK